MRIQRNVYVKCSHLFLLLLSVAYVIYALLRPLPPIRAQVVASLKNEPTASMLTWPSDGSAAVGTPDWGVLASSSDTPKPTASTIKLLTALTVLRAKPFSSSSEGALIILDATDVTLYEAELARGGSVVPVVAGERLTERQALEALLLPSANNIATTLATWAYGSIPAYLAAADQLARSLNMQATSIADASGFSPLTMSTPHDLVELGIAALKNPVIAPILSEKSASLPVVGVVHNVNTLIGSQGIFGGKTGNTSEAGGCFVGLSSLKRDGYSTPIVSAVMGASSLSSALADTPPLVASVAQNITSSPLVGRGKTIATYSIPWSGDSFQAILTQDIAPLRWDDQPATVTVHTAVLSIGQQKAGDVTARIHNQTYTASLMLNHPIPPPSLLWRLMHII